jgi:ABC-2 type transport system ATP-binding protein
MMDNSQPTLVIDQVTKSFDKFRAVDNLSLKVFRGKIFGLIGPNGAGKTTTLRMIVNIFTPDTGQITLFGRPLDSVSQDRIGYLPEERGLYRKMRVDDQLHFLAELKGIRGRRASKAIDMWLTKVKLEAWKNRKVDELSKGMQQKVQFIAAVLHEPDLVILDEPFSGLDPVNVELLKDLVLEQKSSGRAIIFSTHLMEQAERICDDICLLNRSRKVLDGTVRAIKSSFAQNAIAVRGENVESLIMQDGLVQASRKVGETLEVTLVEGSDPQEFLRRLVEAGARIERFELIEPSLHDIFIAKVNEPL